MTWRKAGLIILSSVCIQAGFGGVVAAQGSTFQQQIKPIECTYTQVETGSKPAETTDCDDQPIPMVLSVTVQRGRPVIIGKYSAARSSMLRVWVSGQWFTLGVDSRLTATGDDWTLDLSQLPLPLSPGEYKITVAAQTDEGFLVRHVDSGRFWVNQAPIEPEIYSLQLEPAQPQVDNLVTSQYQMVQPVSRYQPAAMTPPTLVNLPHNHQSSLQNGESPPSSRADTPSQQASNLPLVLSVAALGSVTAGAIFLARRLRKLPK